MSKLSNYIKETRIELKKVTWPTRQETIQYTLAIVISSAAIAVFLGGMDFAFQQILNKFIL